MDNDNFYEWIMLLEYVWGGKGGGGGIEDL